MKIINDQRTPSADPSPIGPLMKSLTAPTPSGPKPSPIRLMMNSSTADAAKPGPYQSVCSAGGKANGTSAATADSASNPA